MNPGLQLGRWWYQPRTGSRTGAILTRYEYTQKSMDSYWLLGLVVASVGIWVGLLGWRGQFWRADVSLPPSEDSLSGPWPSVCAVIPARDEASVLPETLPSLFEQDYPGVLSVVLVDDRSEDGTAMLAEDLARQWGNAHLTVIRTEPLAPGWTGKLWALEQGIRHVRGTGAVPDYWLLTDADICHDAHNVRRLVAKSRQDEPDMVSLMVRLRCRSVWEQLLIPAFVFFFQKLYPFRWVNDPANPTAAAAGGCVLIRRETLAGIGGLEAIHRCLIDDCALAGAVKSSGSSIWLGLTQTTRSLRPYLSLAEIWNMVARTAYTQLEYSLVLLLGTCFGMLLIYGVPPVATLVGALMGDVPVMIAGLVGWLLIATAYLPTLRLYGVSPLLAPCLPAIALLYTVMTVDSARRHWQGEGGAWKGRTYSSK